MEPQRPLVDPDHPDFTIGLTLNGNRSTEFIEENGDVNGQRVKYYTSIEKLTGVLEVHLKHTVVNGLVVLPPPPAMGQVVPLFKIIMHRINDESKSSPKVELLPLLFKKHDLYFVGFRSVEPMWYEYKPQCNKRTYINGSTELPFDCSYLQRTDKHNKGISKIFIDNNMLQAMFQNLRAFDITKKDIPYYRIQEFCNIVCVSICEATRFKRVLRYITNAMNDENMEPFGKELEELIKNWSMKSKAAKKADLQENDLENLKADVSVILY